MGNFHGLRNRNLLDFVESLISGYPGSWLPVLSAERAGASKAGFQGSFLGRSTRE